MLFAARKTLLASTTRIISDGRHGSGIGSAGSDAAASQLRRDANATTTVSALRRPSAAAR